MTSTTATAAEQDYLPLVDAKEFRRLFLDKLGWERPTHKPVTVEDHQLTEVAQFKGLPIWWCDRLPDRPTQRRIDAAMRRHNPEHLLIFTGDDKQEWRWPRHADTTTGANAKLLIHPHHVGQRDFHLADQLAAVRIPLGAHPTLVEVLTRMREAFDVETETASQEAARLMKQLYEALAACGVGPHDSTLLLARLLFLLFGDDAGMWDVNMFRDWLADHTTTETLSQDFQTLAAVLDTEETKRNLPGGDPLTRFRYVNGGLYHDPLTLPPLSATFRDSLLQACRFDWSIISPAIFGSMFQAIENAESRRALGEHYTTETNIMKVIGPLFLDEYHQRLSGAWNSKSELTKLWNDLGRIRIMDPACGCGNFLVVSYRELRALELEIMKRRRDLDLDDGKISDPSLIQTSIDVTDTIKVRLDHFYGIEIEEWPSRIAEVAMLLVDHLANQTMTEEFGFAPDRLPIRIAPTIIHDNALRTDWVAALPPSSDVIITGNPPFLGHSTRNPLQAQDLRDVWGRNDIGRLDYVTGWYRKAIDYFRGIRGGRFAFVSTNSVTQGEPVSALFRPLFDAGWRIRFAHRTFAWTSEASDAAAVYCVAIGFDKETTPPAVLFHYDDIHGGPRAEPVRHINAYLVDGPNVLIDKRGKPLSPDLPPLTFGNMPRDGGGKAKDGGRLVVEPDEYDEVMADPAAAKYIRRYVGAHELVHNEPRWCLWLVDLDPADIARSQNLKDRLRKVREFRSRSTAESTREMATTPHLFGQRSQPDVNFICVPRVVSENRPYLTCDYFPPSVIASDATFKGNDAEGFAFGIISSAMCITWQRTVGGRLKSDLRFSNTLVWNTLPLPPVTEQLRADIIAAGKGVLDARALHPDQALADQYNPLGMDSALVKAHRALDKVVDKAFGARRSINSEEQRQGILFERYAEMTQE